MKNFDSYLKEKMKNPEFKAEYDALEPEFAIMQAIIEKAGTQTPAGAICFSLPVSQVAGLRRIEE